MFCLSSEEAESSWRVSERCKRLLAKVQSSLAVAGFIGVALLVLQWASGAWHAEFDGYPDEAAQFVSGRMIYDFLRCLPLGNPLQWAVQYYVHYPKVALGHWPPAYALLEGLWSLPFGSSRISAMWLQWFSGLAALVGLYHLARFRLKRTTAASVVIFAAATPIFQQGLEQTMAELLCLFCSVLFMHALFAYLNRWDWQSAVSVAATLLLAAAAKGNALCLLPVPFVTVLLYKPRKLTRWHLAAMSAIAITTFAIFSVPGLRYWGGLNGKTWHVARLGDVAGWGFLGIAPLGFKREPLQVICIAMLACGLAVTFELRAMNEARHFILFLPAILILAGCGFERLPRTYAPLLLVPAIAFFPFSFYRQKHTGYSELLAQLHLPARMLVSSARLSGEGAWIAEVSIAERQQQSLIARASKTFAREGWNGENYQLQIADASAALRLLDSLDIGLVVLDEPTADQPPHHVLLASAMRDNPSWQVCAKSGEMIAYCRTKPPQAARVPLTMDVSGFLFQEDLNHPACRCLF